MLPVLDFMHHPFFKVSVGSILDKFIFKAQMHNLIPKPKPLVYARESMICKTQFNRSVRFCDRPKNRS
jgi:hypothetical protein